MVTELLFPAVGEERSRPMCVPIEAASTSLMTPIGIISGEVLTYLESCGATPLRRLTRELGWTSPLVMMAVGALVREGLVRAVQHDLEVVCERQGLPVAVIPVHGEGVPEVWGG